MLALYGADCLKYIYNVKIPSHVFFQGSQAMAKRMIVMLIAAGLIFGGAIAWYFVRQAMIAKFMANMKFPAATVTAMQVKTSAWQPYYESVGSFVAPQRISVTPEIDGIVKGIYFQSGELVHQGQLLVALDDSLQQAKLVSDKAAYDLAQRTYKRNKALLVRHAISQSEFDAATSTLQQTAGAVQADEVIIRQKAIRAPFDGRMGIREVSLGQYISPANTSTQIAFMEQIDPLYVDFQLPQEYVPNLSVGQSVEITIDAFKDRTFSGEIQAFSAGVDQNSRMLTVRAEVPNPKYELLSGMFGSVRVLLPTQQSVLVVPQTAITYNLYGDIAYLVKDGKAVQTFVTVGQRRGNEVQVLKGVKQGDKIVTSGQLKLYNMAPVIVSNQAGP